MKRDVDTVLTYPAVMGSLFVLALQVGVSVGLAVGGPASRGLRRGGIGGAEKPRDRSEPVHLGADQLRTGRGIVTESPAPLCRP